MNDITVTLDFGEAWTAAAEATDTLVEAWTSKPTINSTFGDDEPRVSKAGTIYEHLAADRSQDSRPAVQRAVLEIVRAHGVLGGSQINAYYHDLYLSNGWPKVHPDSPRKRAGELARAKALVITNLERPRGTEAEYALPAEVKGLAA